MGIGFSEIVLSLHYPDLGELTFLHFMIPSFIFLAAFMGQGFKQEISFMLLMW